MLADAPVAEATWSGNAAESKAKPAAAYGALTVPVPPLADIRTPNCSVPADDAVLDDPIAVMVLEPDVRVDPLSVMVYPFAAFVPTIMLWASVSEALPAALSAYTAADDESVPNSIVLSEMLKVSDCATVALTETWSSLSMLTVMLPVSPNVPLIATAYDAGVDALVELVLS